MKNVAKIIMTIVLIITVIVTLFLTISDNFQKSKTVKYEEKILEGLKEKYGDGDYRIVKRKTNDCELKYTYCEPITTLTIATKYMDDTFEVTYNSKYYYGFEDRENFLDTYYKDEWKEEHNSLQGLLVDKADEYKYGNATRKYKGKIYIKSQSVYCDYQYTKWGEIPSIKKLTETCHMYTPEIKVTTYYNENNFEEFKDDVTKVYEYLITTTSEYRYGDQHVDIIFDSKNPYYNGNYNYIREGYIKLDDDKKTYMIYVTGSPVKVDRIKDVIIAY